MRTIYENATAVFAWLGRNQSFGDWVASVQSESTESADEDQRLLIWDVITSPLWRRGWIQQELVVGREVYMMSQKGFVNVHKLNICLEMLRKTEVAGSLFQWDGSCRTYPATSLLQARKTWKGPEDVSLLSWLSRGGSLALTDPRDFVFAFIGLADPAYSVTPDYLKSCGEVFEDAARKIIKHDRSLNILALVNFTESWARVVKDLPSWTPDWSRLASSEISAHYNINYMPSTGLYKPGTDLPPFRAAGSLLHDQSEFHHEGFKLTVQGLRIAGIDTSSLLRDDALYLVMDGIEEACKRFRTANISQAQFPSLREACLNQHRTTDPARDPGLRAAYEWSHAYISARTQKFQHRSSWYWLKQYFLEQGDSGWRTFRSAIGFDGLIHKDAQIGDSIYILFGCNVPLVLRPKGPNYELVGQAFINGLMYGEAIEMMIRGKLVTETIQLV
ncbi:hypothetical protein K432DRAFT_117644 [Lepidopterella palustris CBS 459.81]|uniref:Heterokaryon incompatibility domain-containing protein n=1 Tax=Lepidopterella palustris CBS 459.81 TaxID=1314670 RepID=A0A8E2E5G6_9PEZI|nr:hypothetical protein K432DRAFT_117644 [Lepidopterella palustris CBS 459.81]